MKMKNPIRIEKHCMILLHRPPGDYKEEPNGYLEVALAPEQNPTDVRSAGGYQLRDTRQLVMMAPNVKGGFISSQAMSIEVEAPILLSVKLRTDIPGQGCCIVDLSGETPVAHGVPISEHGYCRNPDCTYYYVVKRGDQIVCDRCGHTRPA